MPTTGLIETRQHTVDKDSMVEQLLQQFIEEESLPESYLEDARRWFLPLLPQLKQAKQDKSEAGPLLLGINGAQGTGKSTLAALLGKLLASEDKAVANLSIDDFYLSKTAREKLAQTVHPLFASRGVPGTHDTSLLHDKIQELSTAGKQQRVAIPRFDKSRDDCCPVDEWPTLQGPVDFIILEGWFIGLHAQAETDLNAAVNRLEEKEDSECQWRQQVNAALAGEYQKVFAMLDSLLMLRAPSFDQVYEWRQVQEDKLRARSAPGASGVMDNDTLVRFIQHFERLTRHCLATLPERADRVFNLDAGHRIVSCQLPRGAVGNPD